MLREVRAMAFYKPFYEAISSLLVYINKFAFSLLFQKRSFAETIYYSNFETLIHQSTYRTSAIVHHSIHFWESITLKISYKEFKY